MSNEYGDFSNLSDQEFTGFDSCKIAVGVKLKKVEYYSGTSKAGNAYEALKFYYQKDLTSGVTQSFIDQVMPLNKEAMKSWRHKTSLEETYEQEKRAFNTKMKHIASKFDITVEELTQVTGNSTSFKDFSSKYQLLLNERIDDRLLYVKFMADKDNRPALPKFPPFLQVMSDDSECILKYTPQDMEQIKKIQASIPKLGSVSDIVEEDDDLDID